MLSVVVATVACWWQVPCCRPQQVKQAGGIAVTLKSLMYIFSRSAISIKSTLSRSSSTLSLASTSSQRLSPIDSIIKHMRWLVWLMCFRILTVLNLAASLQYNYFVGKDLWGHCSLDGTLNGDGSRLLKGKFFSLYSIFSITALFAFWSFPSFLNFRIYSPGTGTLLQLTLWRVK